MQGRGVGGAHRGGRSRTGVAGVIRDRAAPTDNATFAPLLAGVMTAMYSSPEPVKPDSTPLPTVTSSTVKPVTASLKVTVTGPLMLAANPLMLTVGAVLSTAQTRSSVSLGVVVNQLSAASRISWSAAKARVRSPRSIPPGCRHWQSRPNWWRSRCHPDSRRHAQTGIGAADAEVNGIHSVYRLAERRTPLQRVAVGGGTAGRLVFNILQRRGRSGVSGASDADFHTRCYYRYALPRWN